MEKNILINLDGKDIEYLAIQKTNTISSIKKYLEKYENVKIQMYINSENELKVFDTNEYDNITLESVWKSIKNSHIILTSYIKKFTGNKDVDMKILKSLDDKSITNLCKTNKYISGLCQILYKDEFFWENRLRCIAKEKIINKPDNMSWYEYYKAFFQYRKDLCSCNLSKMIRENSRKILKIFHNMKYDQVINLEERDISCHCGECGDEGIRELIQLKKSDKLSVELYFNYDVNDVLDYKNIAGLEFWKKLEKYDEVNKKYDPYMYGEELIFRIDINERKQKIKLRHYRSFSECECVLPDVCINDQCQYLKLAFALSI